MDEIVVVGASLAGSRAVETARRDGFAGRLTLVGDEPHLPYDRPPLSKEVLTEGGGSAATEFHDRAFYDDLDVELRLGRPATALDLDARTVTVGGDTVGWDGLVLATGARARPLPGTEGIDGVEVLRSRDDADAVEAALVDTPRVVVIGAGFIGAEVAASARSRGCEVTVLEALDAPLIRGLGPEMGAACGLLHADHGTDLRCGVRVEAVTTDDAGRANGVRLDDGATIPAELVVVGIGVMPNVEWLAGSGLELDDGIVCDATLNAGHPGVYAAGDVARWPNAWAGVTMRAEHWTSAAEQGALAMRNLLAGPDGAEPYSAVPFVWSDQYDARIQIGGHPSPDDEVEVVLGSVEERSFLAAYHRDGRLTAAMALNLIRPFVQFRRLLMAEATWADAQAKAAELAG